MDYSNGKIYKLVCNTTGLQYIGSTTQPLFKRKHYHKLHYRTWLNGKSGFITSFKIIENNNYDIVLILEYPCENKIQLHRKEREYIESLECVNKYIPNRTAEETKIRVNNYNRVYREKNNEYFEIWRNNNREYINKRSRERVKCDICGNELNRGNLSNHKKKRHKSL